LAGQKKMAGNIQHAEWQKYAARPIFRIDGRKSFPNKN